jgi:hypothetical protein
MAGSIVFDPMINHFEVTLKQSWLGLSLQMANWRVAQANCCLVETCQRWKWHFLTQTLFHTTNMSYKLLLVLLVLGFIKCGLCGFCTVGCNLLFPLITEHCTCFEPIFTCDYSRGSCANVMGEQVICSGACVPAGNSEFIPKLLMPSMRKVFIHQ